MKPEKQRLSESESLFCGVRWPKAKQPKRAEALGLLDKVLPWAELEALIRPHFASDKRKTGRPGVSLKMLIRAWVLQRAWNLSDPVLVDMILDSHAAARFIGSDPWQPRPPSATRFCLFRQLLVNTGLEFDADRLVSDALFAAGLQMRPGLIREPVFKRFDPPCALEMERGVEDV